MGRLPWNRILQLVLCHWQHSGRGDKLLKGLVSSLLVVSNLLLISQPLSAAEPRHVGSPAHEALRRGLAQAKINSRNVFVLYGYSACIPCKLFERYFATPDVKKLFEKYFLLVRIDTMEMPDGEALQGEVGPLGAPAWAILDTEGKVLVDSNDGAGNVGYPSSPRGKAQFVKALKMAVPRLSEAEINTLTLRLGSSATDAGVADSGVPATKAPTDVTPKPHPTVEQDLGVQLLSMLNSPEDTPRVQDQALLLGISLLASAQKALVGTWVDSDLEVEISTEGTPPKMKVRLPAGDASLHLLWDVDAGMAKVSAFAVTRSPAITDAFTFQLIETNLQLQEIVIFTDRSGRPNQIRNRILKKTQVK